MNMNLICLSVSPLDPSHVWPPHVAVAVTVTVAETAAEVAYK